MARAPTAKRYAQAAFQIALEKGQLDGWLGDLQMAQGVVEDGAMRTCLALPRVRLEDKVQAIRAMLNEADPLVQNLVCLLASRLSVELLPAIVEEYQRLLDLHRGRARAEVVTAVALGKGLQRRVEEQLEKLVGKDVILSARVDPGVVGGLMARVGDKVIDGSTRSRLEQLKRSLTEEVLT